MSDSKSQHLFVPLWYVTIPPHGLAWKVIFRVLEDSDKMATTQGVRSRELECGNDEEIFRSGALIVY